MRGLRCLSARAAVDMKGHCSCRSWRTVAAGLDSIARPSILRGKAAMVRLAWTFLPDRGRPWAVKESVQEWRVQLLWPPVAIPEGPARIVVEDGAGQRISKLINVVPVHSLPKPVAQGDLPPTLQTVIAADQLIQTNRRQWGFEAYQDLAALASSYEPARLLRDCLEAIPSCYQR